MGFSKYFEDIEDRYGEDTRERYDKYLKGRTRGPRRTKRIRSGEIWAAQDGRRFEDYMAFPTGAPITFRVETVKGCEPAVVELRGEGSTTAMSPDPLGNYTLSSENPSTGRLILKCGGYLKEHGIHFVQTSSIEKIPEFAALISMLTDNPPGWSTETFPPFRQSLETILAKQGVPKQFADGVIEYHLALYFENQRSPTYGKLLERTHELLQCFTPYSDYAAMICGVYLFRTNSFEYGPMINISRLPSLDQAFRFFTAPYAEAMEPISPASRSRSAAMVDVLIPEADHLTLRALQALAMADLEGAAKLVEDCWPLADADFDPQRERRLTFLEARIRRARGDSKSAAACYERIRYSSQPRFRDEAAEFLKS